MALTRLLLVDKEVVNNASGQWMELLIQVGTNPCPILIYNSTQRNQVDNSSQ